jgi:hypothetical protein
MGKPTANELETAIVAAIAMRESGKDPDHIAKSLLNLNYRLERLEKVMTAAKRYLHAGQSVTDHRQLALAIQAAEKAQHTPDDEKAIPTLIQH